MLSLLDRLLRVNPRRQAAVLLALVLVFTVGGGVAFAVSQGVSPFVGIYWAVTTATTVGYGDVTPHNTAGRVIAILVMLTTIPLLAAVFAVVAGSVAVTRIRSLLGLDRRLPEGRFRLVVGSGPTLTRLLEELRLAHLPVVLVSDVDPGSVPPEVHLIHGDPTLEQVLQRAHPERAEQALLIGATDPEVLVAAVLLRRLAPQLPLSALAQTQQIGQALQALGVQSTICSQDLLAHTLAKSLESPHSGELLLRLVDSDAYHLQEVPADPGKVGQLLSAVRAASPQVILAVVHAGQVSLGVDHDPALDSGDSLLILEPMGDSA